MSIEYYSQVSSTTLKYISGMSYTIYNFECFPHATQTSNVSLCIAHNHNHNTSNVQPLQVNLFMAQHIKCSPFVNSLKCSFAKCFQSSLMEFWSFNPQIFCFKMFNWTFSMFVCFCLNTITPKIYNRPRCLCMGNRGFDTNKM